MRILEELLGGLRRACSPFPDGRQWRPANIEIADAAMAAFSLSFMQSESFLAHQRRMEQGRNTSNGKTLFGRDTKLSYDNIRCCYLALHMPGRGQGVTPEEPAAGNLHGRVCEGGASR